MSRRSAAYQRWRPLLTETLPYEVPVIFTNDYLFSSVTEGDLDQKLNDAIVDLRERASTWSKPYNYQIVKDRFGMTTLGLIHPLHQLRISEFYDSYAETITSQCKRGSFSIRRPGEPTPMFTENSLSPEDTTRQGIPHVNPEEGELDASHVTSYFTYKGYNLLSRFIDSPEYIRLEKRFSRLRTLDVSKCFFNIYTHSISWAVKGKNSAKRDRTLHSFENVFDVLMQRANFNETNGIVIGPEVSRIFAEIILQAVDVAVESSLTELQHNVDYAVRRYVDDYYIFADSEEKLDIIQDEIRVALERYKLFFNENKISTASRPFVTQITLARRDARRVFRELRASFTEFSDATDPNDLRRVAREITSKIGELRMVVGEHGVGFHTLSGWLIGSLRSLLSRTISMSSDPDIEPKLPGIADVAIALYEVITYIVALDLRVRSTFSLAEISIAIDHFAKGAESDHRDRVRHVVHQELSSLIRAATSVWRLSRRPDSVELFNLLITAVHVVGPEVLDDKSVAEALAHIRGMGKHITYFGFITSKFCYLSRRDFSEIERAEINASVAERLKSSTKKQMSEDAELYFLMCDYLSSPDVSFSEKRLVLAARPAAKLSNSQIDALGRHVAFVDWHGMRLEHLLRRKQLRPVYSLS